MRERVAELLREHLGWRVYARDVYPVTGFWKRVDVYRWEVHTPDGKFGCWETMTEFVKLAAKFGVRVDGKEISANESGATP
jgi:hypothetical protein